MSGSLIPNGKQQYFDANGTPLAGGKVYYYIPYTTTAKNTWQDINLSILNTNPIILDAAGECIAWGAGAYRQQVYDVNNNLIWDQYTYGISPTGSNFISQEEVQTATQGQTQFSLTTITYTPGINSLVVFVNGSKQLVNINYTETSSSVVTFASGLNVGDVVDFYASLPASAQNTSNAVTVSYYPPFTNGVATNVQAKLAQTVSVKDFGAKGDGTTDDTTAIQNALNLGQPVYIPYTANGYLVSSTLNATANITCDGFLLANTSFASTVISVNNALYTTKLVVQGLRVQPKTSLVSSSIGIKVTGSNTELRNCQSQNFDIGIQVASYGIILNNCWARQNNTNLSAYAPTSSNEINDLMVNGGSYDSAIQYSCYIGDTRFSTTVASTDQMGVNVIFTNANFDGAPSLFNRVFNLTLQSCYWETTTSSKQGIVLGNSSYGGLIRNVVISNCYFSTIDYPIYCNTSVRNLIVKDNYYGPGSSGASAPLCGLYYQGLGGAGSFQYLRNESTGNFIAQEVHTGYLSISLASVIFSGATIYDDFLANGVQSAPLQTSASNWYPNGITADGHKNISSVACRYKTTPKTSVAGTLSSFAFTCTTLSDCYYFNGGDRFTGTGAASTGGYVQSVDYLTGIITLSLSGGPSSGSATISQVAVTFS